MNRIAAFLLCLLLCSCAVWTRIDQTDAVKGPGGNYHVVLPLGWVQFNPAGTDKLMITRDGPRMQRILLSRSSLEQAFPKLKKAAAISMLLPELAELQVAEMRTENSLTNIEIIETKPATVAGISAYRALLQYKDPKGLPIKILLYGFISKDSYHVLLFEAPQLHYFDRDLPVFEKMVLSARAS